MAFDLLRNWMAKSSGAPSLKAPTRDPAELQQEKDMAKEASGGDDDGGDEGDGDEGMEKAGVAAAATGKVEAPAPVDKTPDAPRADGDMERRVPVTRAELAAFKDKDPGAVMAKGGPGSGIKGHVTMAGFGDSAKGIGETAPAARETHAEHVKKVVASGDANASQKARNLSARVESIKAKPHSESAVGEKLSMGKNAQLFTAHKEAAAAHSTAGGLRQHEAPATNASDHHSEAAAHRAAAKDAGEKLTAADHEAIFHTHASLARGTDNPREEAVHHNIAAQSADALAQHHAAHGNFNTAARWEANTKDRMSSANSAQLRSQMHKSEGATTGAGLQALEKFVKAIPGTTGDLGDSTSSAPMVSHPAGAAGIPGTDGANAGQGKSPHQLAEGTPDMDEDQDVNGGLSQPGAEGGDLNEHIQDGKAPSAIRKAANTNVPQQGIPEIDTGKDSKISADDGPRGEMPSGEPGFAEENGSGPANMPAHPNFPVGDAEQQATGLSAEERKASLRKSGWLTADLPSTGDIETDGAREFQYRRFAAQAGNAPQTVQVSAAPRAAAQPIIAMSKSVNGIPWSNRSDLEVMAFQKSLDAGERMDPASMVNPLMKSMACKACKSEMPAYLDKCPDCRTPVTGNKMEKSLALVVDVGSSNARLQPPAGPEMVNLQHLFKS